jgi:hypothetical protein
MSMSELIGQILIDSRMADKRANFLEHARRVMAQPIIERVYKLEDVGKKGRTWLDGRTWQSPANTREVFALAMSDMRAAEMVRKEMPVLAAAFALTGERSFVERLLAQMTEVASWSPIQRPGWTLFHAGVQPLQDPKGDGNWLATGLGVLALSDTLEILPPALLPPELRTQLEGLLATEIVSCIDDWNVRRPWFYTVQHLNPLTNQWVLPTVGFLLASLLLGREQNVASYELGVEHLLMSFNGYGTEGAFVEGLYYSSFTTDVLLGAARTLAVAGDDRLIMHPFLKRYPAWLVQHYQPGGHFINAFDGFNTAAHPLIKGKRRSDLRSLLALCAVCLESPDAKWALQNLEVDDEPDLNLLLAQAVPSVTNFTPSLWAVYDRASRVNWRSSWAEDATGVWVRGGHKDDQHDHPDRGHVNFICRGKPILIEAGTSAYHNPLLGALYGSGFGHNVLQLGAFSADQAQASARENPPRGLQSMGGLASIDVLRLDATGGEVSVNVESGYQDLLQRWRRRVLWTSNRLCVEDEVSTPGPEIIGFRWHLGTSEVPVITGHGNRFRVVWSDAAMTVNASELLTVSCESLPDHTLQLRKWEDPDVDHMHTCVVVRTEQALLKCTFTVVFE